MKRCVIAFVLWLSIASLAVAESKLPQVRLETNKGAITLELNRDKAPKTVENFLSYVESGFYNGTIFHRVIKGFMIQGGGFTPDMAQKDTRGPVNNEADNGLSNSRGTIAMARTNDPHSATAQFFINAKNNPFLNHTAKSESGWGYCVFGKVVQGMDVVDAIEMVETGSQDVPTTPVVITHAVVLK
ncbi:MAG: peptidylprolyl isomerase [Desulfobacterales bacterium]|jgi:peptidyl-prolyl cis-trans isomerase B (cyclophilin B)|nr:peptidylprolyl isomerase [Desulfobacterales bacterium]